MAQVADRSYRVKVDHNPEMFFYNTNSSDGGYEFYTDDEASRDSMSSVVKQAMAFPPNDITVENSVSEELMKLSLNDRTAIEEEVHGIVRDTPETTEFLKWSLHKFDKELMAAKKSMRRRRKLEKKDDDASADVLRNVIRTTPDYEDYLYDELDKSNRSNLGESSTASASTMETEGPLHMSRIPSANVIIQNPPRQEHSSKKSCYVNDSDVRLRFLRAERYDAKKAVKRFVNFLEFAKELYGDFVADRPIQLSDLKTREEKRALSNVSFQFLPFRDRSGRRVFVSVGTCGYDIEPSVRIKVLWYMYWIASEDIESQQKGVILVGWPCEAVNHNLHSDDEMKTGESDTDPGYNMWENAIRPKLINLEGLYQVKALDGLPLRVTAVHCCFEDRPIYKIVSSLFHFCLNPYLKARFKVHIGEPLEIRYELQGYGIPTDLLPLTHTMSLKRQNHLQWIGFRKLVERNQEGNENDDGKSKGKKNAIKPLSVDPMDLVECPRSYDVIIGKAKYTNNPGNVFYRSLIEATHDEHILASKQEKVELTWRIVRQMEERNGRFLELNKSLKAWVHIKDRKIMRQKVAQSYKEFKRNASAVRGKREMHQQQHNDSNNPDPSIKRQKTVLPTIFENDWFSGCSSGVIACNNDDKDEFVVSRSMFTSM